MEHIKQKKKQQKKQQNWVGKSGHVLQNLHNNGNRNVLTNNVPMSKSALLWVLKEGVYFADTRAFNPGQNEELQIL